MRVLIIALLFVAQYASADACPAFEPGTYTCPSADGGPAKTVTISHAKTSTGEPALLLQTDGIPGNPLSCKSGNQSVEICTAEQRKSSLEIKSLCIKQYGAKKVIMDLQTQVTEISLTAHVVMQKAPLAGKGPAKEELNMLIGIRMAGPQSVDLTVSATMAGKSQNVRASCTKL